MRRRLARLALAVALRLDPPQRDGHIHAAEGAIVARRGESVVAIALDVTVGTRLLAEIAREVRACACGRNYTPGGRHGGKR